MYGYKISKIVNEITEIPKTVRKVVSYLQETSFSEFPKFLGCPLLLSFL